jgi:nicotinamide-nucleotide amidase
VVAYANEVKENHLGVNPAAIAEHGAVSEVVVRQMADGVRLKMGTDYALAVSGIAGPDGGTEEKPVGTTWIALSSKEQTITQKFLFGEHRGRNIRKAALQALDMLRLELKLNA